jgi:hypothetical protein
MNDEGRSQPLVCILQPLPEKGKGAEVSTFFSFFDTNPLINVKIIKIA